MDQDLGESIFKTWSNKQRHDEIARLVEGHRNGVPVGILCKMAESVAGSRKRARRYLHEMMTAEERQSAVAKETGGLLFLVKEFML